jgi:hypothetical protein
MKLRGGEYSTGTTGNFQSELTIGLLSGPYAKSKNLQSALCGCSEAITFLL